VRDSSSSSLMLTTLELGSINWQEWPMLTAVSNCIMDNWNRGHRKRGEGEKGKERSDQHLVSCQHPDGHLGCQKLSNSFGNASLLKKKEFAHKHKNQGRIEFENKKNLESILDSRCSKKGKISFNKLSSPSNLVISPLQRDRCLLEQLRSRKKREEAILSQDEEGIFSTTNSTRPFAISQNGIPQELFLQISVFCTRS